MTVLFDGRVRVDHHQFHLESGDAEASYDEAFASQANGLVGAGVPGALTLSVGTATGDVGLRAVLVEAGPGAPGPEWEDVAEVSFRPLAGGIVIREPMGSSSGGFAVPVVDYRVRLCAQGIDAAWDGQVGSDEPLRDHYELVLWPAPPTRDAVLRLTSENEIAAHRDRPATGVVPPTVTRDDRWFTRLSSDLAAELLVAGPHAQRQLSYRAAHRACVEAGISEVEEVATGLRALSADEPLPLVLTLPGLTAARVGLAGDRADRALHGIVVAADADPLDAAQESVAALHALVGDEELLTWARAELRLLAEQFPRPLPDSRSPVAEDVLEDHVVPDAGPGWSAPPLPPDDPRARYLDRRPVPEQIAAIARPFPELVARVDGLDADRQRREALRIAQYCVRQAELHLPWVNDAFLAFGQRNAPSPWAEGTEGVWLLADPRWRQRTTLRRGRPVPVWPLALRAVRHAVGPDPREALLLSILVGVQVSGDTGRAEFLRGLRLELDR